MTSSRIEITLNQEDFDSDAYMLPLQKGKQFWRELL
jgi:hypothetical protein